MLKKALVWAVIFGLAPIQGAQAVTMLHPLLEGADLWWVFWVAHAIWVAVTYQSLRELKKTGKLLTPSQMILKHYLKPLLVLALAHVVLVMFCECGREWSALIRTAKPPPPAKADSREIRPPPHGPPPSIRPVLSAAMNLVAKLARSAAVFLLRLWLGPPLWIAFVVAAVTAVRYNPTSPKNARI